MGWRVCLPQPTYGPPPQVCERSCAALSVLALRRPEHCRIIMECGGVQAAVQAMKAHPQEVSVQVRLQLGSASFPYVLNPAPRLQGWWCSLGRFPDPINNSGVELGRFPVPAH